VLNQRPCLLLLPGASLTAPWAPVYNFFCLMYVGVPSFVEARSATVVNMV
jgi:hypothetical protein